MGVSLALLMIGCLLRVSSEVLAYEHYAMWAWRVLPVSGFVELGALATFAVNLGCTLWA
jgi:hypothetical protein